jgi:hypothetical protein
MGKSARGVAKTFKVQPINRPGEDEARAPLDERKKASVWQGKIAKKKRERLRAEAQRERSAAKNDRSAVAGEQDGRARLTRALDRPADINATRGRIAQRWRRRSESARTRWRSSERPSGRRR